MFGVARQFGGQGYSPAKRTLSWLTRGLLDTITGSRAAVDGNCHHWMYLLWCGTVGWTVTVISDNAQREARVRGEEGKLICIPR